MSYSASVWRTRYESPKYILNPHNESDVLVNAHPLIISIKKTYEGHLSKERKYTDRDVALLKDMFRVLKFKEPVIWTDSDDENERRELDTKQSFLTALKDLSKKPEFTSRADMFVCVVLAHGDDGYFCLPNRGNFDNLIKVMFTEVIDIFKGSNCPGLILKPKILIAQTCDFYLRKIDRSLFQGDRDVTVDIVTVPMETDIFCYQSTISGTYMKYIKKKNADFYRGLGETVDQICGYPSTPLVYNLQKSVQEMITNRDTASVNLDELVIEVNQKIEKFIKSENWKIREGDYSWSDEQLKVPLCLNQLTKELEFTLPQDMTH